MNAYSKSVVVSLAVIAWVIPHPSRAQDPVKVGPNVYQTVFENSHVRVNEVRFKPGEKIGMHSHPDHVVYILSAGKLKFGYPDNTTKDMEFKVGDVVWLKAESHQAENVGGTEFRALVVELRDPAPSPGQTTAGVAATDDPMKVAADMSKVLFENERVRVLDTALKPAGKMPMHGHPPVAIYSASAAKLRFTSPDGKTTEKDVAVGDIIWNDPVRHAVENIGTTEARAIHFELKQPK